MRVVCLHWPYTLSLSAIQGIPSSYRRMEGSGVNTYKWVNKDGVGHLVKYHWVPTLGVKNLTQQEADAIQGANFNHGTQDLYDAIEKQEYPSWEMNVQIMEDHEHPELDFDPLDPTKICKYRHTCTLYMHTYSKHR